MALTFQGLSLNRYTNPATLPDPLLGLSVRSSIIRRDVDPLLLGSAVAA